MKFVEKLTFHGSQSPCKNDDDGFDVTYCLREFLFFWKLIFWGHFLAGKNELVDFYFAFSRWILVIEKSVFFFLPSIDHSKCVIYNILTWKWKLSKTKKGDFQCSSGPGACPGWPRPRRGMPRRGHGPVGAGAKKKSRGYGPEGARAKIC